MIASSTTADVVASLKSLRDDYQSKLKESPQYAAFVALEHAWTSAADALGVDLSTTVSFPSHQVDAPLPKTFGENEGASSSSDTSSARDVVAALTTAHSKYRQHLDSVPQYRALLAINKLIDELSASDLEEPAIELVPLSGLDQDTNYEAKVENALADDASTSGGVSLAQLEEPEPLPANDAAVSASETEQKSSSEDLAFPTAEALAQVEFAENPAQSFVELSHTPINLQENLSDLTASASTSPRPESAEDAA